MSGNPPREGYPVILGTFSSLTWTRFLDPEPGWDEQMNSKGQDWEGWGRRKEQQPVGLWSDPQTWLLVKLLNPQSAWCKWISYPTEAAALRQCVWGKEQKQLTQTHKQQRFWEGSPWETTGMVEDQKIPLTSGSRFYLFYFYLLYFFKIAFIYLAESR